MPTGPLTRVAATTALLMAVGASSASASTVSVAADTGQSGVVARYVARPGEVNDVTAARLDEYTVRFDDPGAVILIGEGCTSIDDHTAQCSSPGKEPRRVLGGVAVETGDGNDRVQTAGDVPVQLRADGGPGDDVLVGGVIGDQLDGGGGRDDLQGGPGSDTLTDGDTSAAHDSDRLAGGDGTDTVSYANRTQPVFVELSYSGNAGERGEHDRLFSINSAIGGSGDDRLSGSGSYNTLEGMRGDDRVEGRGADDKLYGGGGRDMVLGQFGDDLVVGGHGRDHLYGGQGEDSLTPESGGDRVDCGSGADVTRRPHAGDVLHADCELVGYGPFTASAYPSTRHRSPVEFSMDCPSRLSRRLHGTLRLRESGGVRRTLAYGSITRGDSDRCHRNPSRGLTITAHLTHLGRRLTSGARAVDSTVSLSGRSLRNVSWTIELHNRVAAARGSGFPGWPRPSGAL